MTSNVIDRRYRYLLLHGAASTSEGDTHLVTSLILRWGRPARRSGRLVLARARLEYGTRRPTFIQRNGVTRARATEDIDAVHVASVRHLTNKMATNGPRP